MDAKEPSGSLLSTTHPAPTSSPASRPPAQTWSASRARIQVPHNAPDAALRGALLAFSKPKVVAVAKTSRSSAWDIDTGKHALSAAKSVNSLKSSSNSTERSGFGEDADRIHREKEIGRAQQLLTRRYSSIVSSSSSSTNPSRSSSVDRASSLRAASIAAARHQRPKPSPAPSQLSTIAASSDAVDSLPSTTPTTPPPIRSSRSGSEYDGSMDKEDEPPAGLMRTDSKSIESTRSLVKMFEQNSATQPARGGEQPLLSRQLSVAKGKPPPIIAPKPQRTVSVQSVSPEMQRPVMSAKTKTALTAVDQNGGTLPSSSPAPRPATAQADLTTPSKPQIPAARRSAKKPPSDGHSLVTESLPPPVRKLQQQQKIPAASSSSPSTSTAPTNPYTYVLPSNPRRASPAPYKDTSITMLTPHLTGDSLANAMVGANLAIKSTSPPKRARTPPPLPPSRRGKNHTHHASDLFHRSRSLSPQKKPGKMLTTLRGDDAEIKEKLHKHRFRTPNKHHEGTRERWRDYISEPERKRYEGVWAANKGLYTPRDPDDVCNLIVKDIWSRSRLPPERLGRIWELVTLEENQARTLTREQFVVGLWLIDQCLKGRNLPHSVNASVWASVRLRGVKVRLEGKGKDGRKLERGADW